MKELADRTRDRLHSWAMWGLIEQHRLILDAVFLGVVGALGAQLFMWLLRLAQTIFLKGIASYTPLGLVNEGGSPVQVIGSHGLWLIPVATTLGGLISGILVFSLAPRGQRVTAPIPP